MAIDPFLTAVHRKSTYGNLTLGVLKFLQVIAINQGTQYHRLTWGMKIKFQKIRLLLPLNLEV